MNKKKSESGFTGQLGFVLAAAGSAVGVGNIWRFPYLAAKDGGGLFILIYLILVVTFGFTLLTSDIAIGRKTKQSSIKAYETMKPGWGFLGKLTFLVPVLIMTYYAVIGGWITRYILVYVTGMMHAAAGDTFFSDFITSTTSPVIYSLFFMLLTAWIIYRGVQDGIEKISRIVMPILLVMIIGIAVYAMTLSYTSNGATRTGLDGLRVYLTVDLSGMTVQKFLQVMLDAMSQLFFSLSVSMGIMITYGSYVKNDVNLGKAVTQIEVFDTVVALLAGMMIIPSIYVFSGMAGMQAGPGLMFVSLPKVFDAMGTPGIFVGLAFFIMSAFAALTSCISVLEAITANCIQIFDKPRESVTKVLAVIYSIASVIVTLGYSIFYFDVTLPTGAHGQLLDVMDYISNSFLMPLISFLSAILIGWIVKPEWIIGEMERNGEKFRRKKLYAFMIKYIVPVIMMVLFLESAGFFNLIF
ncbi:sodium-dependent transporter [Catenisphaera adipataccumulans]|jgi:NSS family neurotransmitter:Na+ symporter|uniref:NSS family neurotransmitter:Na+ symporter n=1 Tax=Catenisphaera adipataccumulans TaxID=700500 RepID=A0A7W8FV60_9FIRM|nr:sodium-dependent transporter [Catenisphaera adipataccumulans]MBB5183294.1 NSS family neurotransmitter:Na+ symporter [Catenisphaera adipataccumulans]